MHIAPRLFVYSFLASTLALAGCSKQHPAVTTESAATGLAVPSPARVAPDSFMVSVETTRGLVTMEMYRAWAPRGVDRFYQLVTEHYYDSAAVHRVVPGFVVQFGLAADPAHSARYRRQYLPDDTVRTSNLRGTVTFARAGPNSRTTQLFINLADNPRLDVANGFGFPPIGRVLAGMAVVDLFNAEYAGQNVYQDSLMALGNRWVARAFPHLDYIVRMKVTKTWGHR